MHVYTLGKDHRASKHDECKHSQKTHTHALRLNEGAAAIKQAELLASHWQTTTNRSEAVDERAKQQIDISSVVVRLFWKAVILCLSHRPDVACPGRSRGQQTQRLAALLIENRRARQNTRAAREHFLLVSVAKKKK